MRAISARGAGEAGGDVSGGEGDLRVTNEVVASGCLPGQLCEGSIAAYYTVRVCQWNIKPPNAIMISLIDYNAAARGSLALPFDQL